jgi:hypothetical protein
MHACMHRYLARADSLQIGTVAADHRRQHRRFCRRPQRYARRPSSVGRLCKSAMLSWNGRTLVTEVRGATGSRHGMIGGRRTAKVADGLEVRQDGLGLGLAENRAVQDGRDRVCHATAVLPRLRATRFTSTTSDTTAITPHRMLRRTGGRLQEPSCVRCDEKICRYAAWGRRRCQVPQDGYGSVRVPGMSGPASGEV